MSASDTTTAPVTTTVTRSFIWLGAIATGVIVTNLFAPQILVGQIGPALHMTAAQAGLISTLTLLGYALGLFLLVPLADRIENKRLILTTLCGTVVAALCTALAPTPTLLLVAVFVLGGSCAAIQMLVPLIAAMAPPADRGRVIGEVMGGLMVGILLSRPLASFIADLWSWRGYYALSAASVALLGVALGARLPSLRPAAEVGYLHLLGSFWTLWREEPVLRVRAWTAALVMASFTAYWAAAALRLAAAPFQLDARGIAAFALVGAAGAVATPLAGRLGDRGYARPLLIASHLAIILSCALCAAAAMIDSQVAALALLVIGTVVLDMGVTVDQTLGRRAVNLLRPEARGRLNGLFVGLFFIGGAIGAAAAATAWSLGGWSAVCAVAGLFGLLALITDLVTRTGSS
ncbi:MFS transporter [Bradyrhizobium sp. 2TAF24]|uniref:MFS transporter n=1 Tax=Bradyrhizobium sp. 2TAF24 TaxID=3233011 RepID=UPI003F901529